MDRKKQRAIAAFLFLGGMKITTLCQEFGFSATNCQRLEYRRHFVSLFCFSCHFVRLSAFAFFFLLAIVL
ncbi:hypothetical protein CGJ60_20125 [Vibrio parahaemolyticus]|nr:hypothetical protein CGJ60_20125 [Vibrio parahaemolyticus]